MTVPPEPVRPVLLSGFRSLLLLAAGFGLLFAGAGREPVTSVLLEAAGLCLLVAAGGNLLQSVGAHLRDVLDERGRGRRTADRLVDRLASSAIQHDEPADLGWFAPDPTWLDAEAAGGPAGIERLQELAASVGKPRRARTAARTLLYLGLDPTTGGELHAEEELDVVRRRRALIDRAPPEPEVLTSRQLAFGGLAIAGGLVCCLLAWAGAAPAVTIATALGIAALATAVQ